MDGRHIPNPYEDYSEEKQKSVINSSGKDVSIKQLFFYKFFKFY